MSVPPPLALFFENSAFYKIIINVMVFVGKAGPTRWLYFRVPPPNTAAGDLLASTGVARVVALNSLPGEDAKLGAD